MMYLNYIDVFWITLMNFELHWCILDYTDVFWITLMYFELHWCISNYTRTPLGYTPIFCSLLEYTGVLERRKFAFGRDLVCVSSLPLFADILCAWLLWEDEMGICKYLNLFFSFDSLFYRKMNLHFFLTDFIRT